MTSTSVRTRSQRTTVLGAAALVLASAALQALAAVERWVVAAGDGARAIEDHRFDYVFPAEPWENVGAAAQLYGAGTILLAGGVLLIGRAFGPPRARPLVVPVVVSFGLLGLHALVSGLLGAPTLLGGVALQLVLGGLSALALVALALVWARRSWAAALAALLLLGATLPGYLLATFVVAPAVMGYQSYDTTPWTEGVVAASTAAAGLLLLVSARARDVA